MATTPLSGKAETVLGPVDGDAMGITLPHKHLLIDFSVVQGAGGGG
jgi:predicted metal-dependent phosphotriesterase family hydrolase